MNLSVVIPCHNVEATLAEQLDAFTAQKWDGEWEVVVVDNRSTDGTAAIVERYCRLDPRIRLVAAFDRKGLSYARNAGIEAATAPNVAICDGDDIVGPRWVAAMGDALADHPCVTGPLELDRLNPKWLADSRGRRVEREMRTFNGTFPVAAGGNVGIRREVIDRVGPFDETLGMTSEVELSFRLWRAGIPVIFQPDAYIHYRYKPSPRDLWNQGRAYGNDHPRICKMVRDAGVTPPSRVAGWRSWAWLPLNVHRLGSAEGRAAWTWVAGNRFGQLEGSVRHRSFYV